MEARMREGPELAGRAAVVTGGSRGLAREGAAVGVADIDEAGARAVAEEIDREGGKAIGVVMDVASPESVDEAFRHIETAWGRVDILVNSAGVLGPFRPVWETSIESWDRLIAVHLRGTFLCCRRAVPGMLARRWGRIVNLASIAGKEGFALDSAYCAAKAGVIAFTKSLAKETALHGIRVNAVAPTVIETDLIKGIPADEMAEKQRRIPLGRFGKPEEVAALIHFLVSDESSYITGQCSDISGGRATY
jgi:3-oxoacyl-[acyl-carrier protein] reductase